MYRTVLSIILKMTLRGIKYTYIYIWIQKPLYFHTPLNYCYLPKVNNTVATKMKEAKTLGDIC